MRHAATHLLGQPRQKSRHSLAGTKPRSAQKGTWERMGAQKGESVSADAPSSQDMERAAKGQKEAQHGARFIGFIGFVLKF